MDSLLPRFAGLLADVSSAEIVADPTLGGRLTLASSGPIEIAYAPFDHVNAAARLVLVGITPGRQQATNALVEAAMHLKAGATIVDAARAAKQTASFSGPMRSNLPSMLDRIGIASWLGIASSEALFGTASSLVHYTSALRYPVYVSGANYAGTPRIASIPQLLNMVSTYLAAEARVLDRAVWVPLGPVAASALAMLVAGGDLAADHVLNGLPHPSGANGERIAYFLGRKPAAALSAKTNASQIDRDRAAILDRMSRLGPR